jgi:hypothetical protein
VRAVAAAVAVVLAGRASRLAAAGSMIWMTIFRSDFP